MEKLSKQINMGKGLKVVRELSAEEFVDLVTNTNSQINYYETTLPDLPDTVASDDKTVVATSSL